MTSESLPFPDYLTISFLLGTIPSTWWQSSLVYLELWAWFKFKETTKFKSNSNLYTAIFHTLFSTHILQS
jgi:hypothetical protein